MSMSRPACCALQARGSTATATASSRGGPRAPERERQELGMKEQKDAGVAEATRGVSGEHRLPRTGDVPLVFQGELVAAATGARFGGRDHTRWYEVEVFRTEDGAWVGHVQFRTTWVPRPPKDPWGRGEVP